MNNSKITKIKSLDAELVVIGGGGAALAAAVTAAEKGVKVTLLEKRDALGGNSVFPEGLFAAESPVQRRKMIEAPRDQLFRTAMKYSHWKVNPRIVRAFIDKSGDTIGWLEEKGLKFDFILPLWRNQVPLVWHCPNGGGAAIVKVLVNNCKDLGVNLFLNTTARRIIINKKGAVSGVLAVSRKKEIGINARSIIIATGGYGGNKELLKKYYPSYIENLSLPGTKHLVDLPILRGIANTGDGLLLATEIGAATEGLGLLQLNGPRVPESAVLSMLAQEPEPILVNKNGERYVDESIDSHFERGNAADRQPDKISYALIDEEIRQKIMNDGFISFGFLLRDLNLNVPQAKLSELENELKFHVETGSVKISDSWEGIADWIGVAPELLQSTIDEYNSFCARGKDGLFAKDPKYLLPLRTPPYYAVRCYSTFLGTVGGIKINHRMEVINLKDKPIPGLYAAGVDAGGWESDTYNANLAGATFGFAINSGRIAAEYAAKTILED